jgi:phospholipase/lecithinase/hemolysin
MLMSQFKRMVAAAALVMLSAAAMAGSSSKDGIFKGPFSRLVAFSGSLSDTGNHSSVNGDMPPPFFMNRTSNGPVAIDILAGKFGLSSAPSLHLIGQQGGTNYAALHANAAGNLPIDLPAQLRAFFSAFNNVADSKALYFMFIGANDIVAASIEMDEQKSRVFLVNGINEVEKSIRQLHAAGARVFYAPNNVNLGRTPVTRDFGLSTRATQKTQEFNLRWELLMRRLERELDVTIFRFDFYRYIEEIFPITEKLGFTNVTQSCLALQSQGLCDLDRFGFLTELLPTKRIHDLLGNALSIALIEQLNTPTCTVRHRCGRKDEDRSYAAIDLSTSFNMPDVRWQQDLND